MPVISRALCPQGRWKAPRPGAGSGADVLPVGRPHTGCRVVEGARGDAGAVGGPGTAVHFLKVAGERADRKARSVSTMRPWRRTPWRTAAVGRQRRDPDMGNPVGISVLADRRCPNVSSSPGGEQAHGKQHGRMQAPLEVHRMTDIPVLLLQFRQTCPVNPDRSDTVFSSVAFIVAPAPVLSRLSPPKPAVPPPDPPDKRRKRGPRGTLQINVRDVSVGPVGCRVALDHHRALSLQTGSDGPVHQGRGADHHERRTARPGRRRGEAPDGE